MNSSHQEYYQASQERARGPRHSDSSRILLTGQIALVLYNALVIARNVGEMAASQDLTFLTPALQRATRYRL